MSRFRKQLADRLSAWLIRAGGMGIILCVVAVVVVIGWEALPLFYEPTGASRPAPTPQTADGPADVETAQTLTAGIERFREIFFLVKSTGDVEFRAVENGRLLGTERVVADTEAPLKIATLAPDGSRLIVATDDGQIQLGRVRLLPQFDEAGERSIVWRVSRGDRLELPADSGAPAQLNYRVSEDGEIAVAVLTESGRLFATLGEEGDEFELYDLTSQVEGTFTSVTLDESSTTIAAGTAQGRVHLWRLIELQFDGESESFSIESATSDDDDPITAMTYLIGGRSLIVGTRSGRVSVWARVPDSQSEVGYRYAKLRDLPALDSAVAVLTPSVRDKGLAALASDGTVHIQHSTSNRELLRLPTTQATPRSFVITDKMDSGVVVDETGTVTMVDIENSHPEASLVTLFDRVWYEGYEKPEYVWQSTGGSDDFEPKLSLMPLIFGTFKATLFALIFSVPISLLAALYTSQFMSPRGRALTKPIVEIMAALPSVVIGLLAGLWLASLLKSSLGGLVSVIVILPLVVLTLMVAWSWVPEGVRMRLSPPGTELIFMTLLLAAAGWAALALGPWVEAVAFDGDLTLWMLTTLDWQYDERNTIVVSLALGFAVIPIIYTISEDSLSAVPNHLRAGSLALGASRWQTAVRVVLPTASPGIFSAIMVGFGRAIGETMIVLMATGNTPIMDWSIFNGMRTMSANIAVEVPEAPHGGTLYRVLFLTAFLLFVFTFAINTIAELARVYLRRRYQTL